MTMKVGAFGHKMTFRCVDDSGNPIDFTGYEEFNLYMKLGDEVKEVSCEIYGDPEDGVLSYTVEEDFYDVAGTAEYEVEALSSTKATLSINTIKERVKPRIKEVST